jgi:hypothetical protein
VAAPANCCLTSQFIDQNPEDSGETTASQKRYSVFTLRTGNEAMTSGTDISVLYQEFTDALTEVLAENSAGPARRGRLARARAAAKKHPKYTEHEYFLAVETAFTRWELIQNTGR